MASTKSKDSRVIMMTLSEMKELIRETIKEERGITSDDTVIPKNVVNALPNMGVSETTLRRWDKSGYLPKVHIGQRVGYRKSDLKRIGVL